MIPATIKYYTVMFDDEQEPSMPLTLYAIRSDNGLVVLCYLASSLGTPIATALEDAANEQGLTLGL